MIKPCKYCGRLGYTIFTKNNSGKIEKTMCVYCKGKGFNIIQEKKEVKDGILE